MVWIYVYMYLSVSIRCICVYVSGVFVRMAWLHVYIHLCAYIHVYESYTCMHAHKCMYTHSYTCIYAHKCMYTYAQFVFTCMNRLIYISVYVCTYTCVCTYVGLCDRLWILTYLSETIYLYVRAWKHMFACEIVGFLCILGLSHSCCGVASIGRLLKIICLFGRIQSLL